MGFRSGSGLCTQELDHTLSSVDRRLGEIIAKKSQGNPRVGDLRCT
jgi:hypothetical protein